MTGNATDLVKRTVDREAQRCGIRRESLAGWLLTNGWTAESFLEAAKDEPDWSERMRVPPSPNPWDELVQRMRADAEQRTVPERRSVPADNYHDFSEFDDDYDAAYDTQLATAELPERADDVIDCRLFYAWQEWKQKLREHEERTGRRLAPHAYRRARADFARRLERDYGKSGFSSSWEERHLKWHKDKGTDPR